MKSLDSQGEIVPIDLSNPEVTQMWDGENKSVHSRQHLILQLLLVISALFDKQELDAMVTV